MASSMLLFQVCSMQSPSKVCKFRERCSRTFHGATCNLLKGLISIVYSVCNFVEHIAKPETFKFMHFNREESIKNSGFWPGSSAVLGKSYLEVDPFMFCFFMVVLVYELSEAISKLEPRIKAESPPQVQTIGFQK